MNSVLGFYISLFISCPLGWVFLIRPIGTLLCSLQLPNQGRWWNQCWGWILTGIWNEHPAHGINVSLSLCVSVCECEKLEKFDLRQVSNTRCSGWIGSLLGNDGGRVLIKGRRVCIWIQPLRAILLKSGFILSDQTNLSICWKENWSCKINHRHHEECVS